MSFPFVVRGDPGDQFVQGTDKLHLLGSRMEFQDGRKFRYTLAGELLVVGETLQGAVDANNLDIACAAGTVGDTFISVTAGYTSAKNFYQDGYIYVNVPGSTKVYLYTVSSHILLVATTGQIINISDRGGTQQAIVGNEQITLRANPWSGVITYANSATAGFAGIAVEDIASSAYGWVQTGGPVTAQCATAVVEGASLTPLGQAGVLDVEGAAGEPIVGYFLRGQSSQESLEASLIFLTVD